MAKFARAVKYTLFTLTLCFLSLLLYSFYTVPDEIYTLQDAPSGVSDIYTLTYEQTDSKGMRSFAAGKYKVKVSLLNMPIKDSTLLVGERRYVAISGDIIGLRLFTQGVLVVDIDTIYGPDGYASPGEKAGLKKGDIICKINGEDTLSSNDLHKKIKYSGGKSMDVEYIRDGKHYLTVLTPVLSTLDDTYKGGLWVRDSAAGIGTVSFYDVNSGLFAALGHAVCDVDTGDVLPLLNGDVVKADIVGCRKGVSGTAGELCGVFTSESQGVLIGNSVTGVYGIFDEWDKDAEVYPVATEDEIEKGAAQMLSTVDSSGKKFYDIEILKINGDSPDNKNMVIQVTDKELISKTGGIVQGMSGSPIIQNGRFVGVVTHVLINNPEKGYAIFAETMLEAG